MARRKPPSVSGALLIDKPAGITSHDVVSQLRRRLGERRIGHAGTLDPPATGLLVVAVGWATRLLRFVTEQPKTYEAVITFGSETTTGDAEGEPTVAAARLPTAEEVLAASGQFLGEIMQVPPAVSALKVAGQRSHQLVRAGQDVAHEPRPVTVHRFDVAATPDPTQFTATATVGSGTYIRSLAVDLGRAVGSAAHLASLRRTASGPFTVAEAGTPDAAPLLPVETLSRAMPNVPLTADELSHVAVGGWLDGDRFGAGHFEGNPPTAEGGAEAAVGPPPASGPWALLAPDGSLAAVHELRDGVVRPAVVIPAEI